jgi:hypothetical protein
LPGAVRYGDVPGLLSLCAPRPLWIAGEGEQTPDIVQACYEAAGAVSAVTLDGGPEQGLPERLVKWLLS